MSAHRARAPTHVAAAAVAAVAAVPLHATGLWREVVGEVVAAAGGGGVELGGMLGVVGGSGRVLDQML